MKLFDTPHKRKSLLKTSVTMGSLLLLMFFLGLKYLDPPLEKGIEVVFGNPTSEENVPAVSQKTATKVEKVNETPEPVPQKKEELVTQSVEQETIVVPKKNEEKPKKVAENQQKKTEQITEEKPKISQEATNALANILGASTPKQGDADNGQQNTQSGKGAPDGNPYASTFYKEGSGKGWGLNGRTLVSGEKVKQDCNEAGRVVVRIEVDKQGKVVKVTPGVKGTTNSAPCLMEAARKTAITYQWNSDEKAPNLQIGFIEINFSLGQD